MESSSTEGESQSAMQQFYRNRKVLVTGASGFMGKVLIEKLLRSTQISTLFLLMRIKKGKTVQQRTTELFDDVVFSRLKEEVKDWATRVRVLEGDVAQPGLGLHTTDSLLLQTEVDLVFHGAATVRFDEMLGKAILTNVQGTKAVLQLARSCPNLKAFVHISTAYANCTQKEIQEDFFEPPLTGDNAIQLTECLSNKQLEVIAHPLCGEYPNTYAFTKAIAENVVKIYGQGLSVVVFRPAIVVATAEEPIKGWIDNVYGPTGVQCGVGAGLLRTFQVNDDFVADLVPVDMAINAIVVSAWDIAQHRNGEDDMQVYNYVSSCQNPLVWRQFIDMSLHWGRHSPSIKSLWYYTMYSSKFYLIYLMYHWLLHLFPALIADSVLLLAGKKTRMWRIYKRIHKFSEVITYFSTRQWLFHNSQVVQLWHRMSKEDQRQFNFDMCTLNWDQFFKNTIWGLRKNFFKDTPDTLPAAKRRQFWFFVLHYLLQTVVIGAVIWLVWRAFLISRLAYQIYTVNSCLSH